MGTQAVTATLPVELNFVLHPNRKIAYECSRDHPQHLKLRHGESLRFCSSNRFTIRFLEESPFWPDRKDTFLEPRRHGSRWEWTSSVRGDAACKSYPYMVELIKEGHLSVGVPEGVTVMEDPEVIIVESGQN